MVRRVRFSSGCLARVRAWRRDAFGTPPKVETDAPGHQRVNEHREEGEVALDADHAECAEMQKLGWA